MSTYPDASLIKTLDTCFNTESVLFLDSTRRNVGLFPNANSFQMLLPKNFVKTKEFILTHFIMTAGNIPGTHIYIKINELQGTNSFTPGSGQADNNFIIPGGVPFYVSQDSINDISVFPRQAAPDIGTITIQILDSTGTLVAINDYIIRFYIRSRY
jgi:hypothetical protein